MIHKLFDASSYGFGILVSKNKEAKGGHMKKLHLIALGLGIIFLGILASPGKGTAGVNVSIGLALPLPQVVVAPPPRLVPITGTAVYYLPGYETDIFYYSGDWYHPSGRNWYRATAHNGPWNYIAPARVPQVVITLPGSYYQAPDRHRVYYREHDHRYKRHWKHRRHDRKHWRHDHDRWDRHDHRYDD